MANAVDLPEPDRIEGLPHPREASALFGHDAAETEFLTAHSSGRLHSGWLLTGPRGIGKATLAYRLAAFLLTTDDSGSDAGLFAEAPAPRNLDIARDSGDLRLIRAGAHPQLKVVRRGPTERGDRLSQEIRASDVRALKTFFQLSATNGGRRVVIVDAADEMNPTAANAILKELEEPPPRTTLLLVSHQPLCLLPTIRSRCRTLRLSPLSGDDMARALEQAGVAAQAADALAILAAGSVGEAARLEHGDGLNVYAQIVDCLSSLPRLDRTAAAKLADACAGRAGETRFRLTLDLLERFIARAAKAGVHGEPSVQAAPGEARLLARLAPGPSAARGWADAHARLSARARHGQAVNLDPSTLTLDMLLGVESMAQDLMSV